MKKILFILPFSPYPLLSGGHQALYNGIVAVKDYMDVSVAFASKDDENFRVGLDHFREVMPNVHIFPMLIHSQHSFKNKIIYTVKKVLRWLLYNNNTTISQEKREIDICHWWLETVSPLGMEWLEHISKVCSQNNFDIIQVEMPRMVSQILTLPVNVKKVYVHHELGFVKRNLESQTMGKSQYMIACHKFADYNELSLLNMYDTIITLSEIDNNKLKSFGINVPIKTSFAVINSSVQIVDRLNITKRLTFVGPSTHTPNRIGIKWFLENCWKELKRIDPDYKLEIVGHWNKDYIEMVQSKYEDVFFLGYVDNLKATLKDSVMIVPITIGSGIRMKILEACSNGIPFVSTSVGAEGIPVVHGKHCFLANTPSEFVNAIINIQDADVQMKFVKNSALLIKQYYSLESLRDNRMSIYADLCCNN